MIADRRQGTDHSGPLTTAHDATDNVRAVMAFARHNKPDVTAGYTRTTNEQLRKVSDALRF